MAKFEVTAPAWCFPSDNELDSMARTKRIAIKKQIKDEAFGIVNDWFKLNGLKRYEYKPAKPFLTRLAALTLTLYYSDNRDRDMPNISEKHFLDQVKAMGIIGDDSFRFIKWCKTEYGGKVAGLSCAVFTLEEIGEPS